MLVLLASCLKLNTNRNEMCDPKAFTPVYVGAPDLCCEYSDFGWIKIQNTSNDTLYRPYGLGVWTYYPGKITKERYFNSDVQQAIEIFRNVNYNGNIATYSSLIYSAPNAPIICDTIFVNL